MSNQELTLTAANTRYLLAINELDGEESGVKGSVIAKSLGVTKPSVRALVMRSKTTRRKHCDCNSYFASVECIDRPELKLVPMAVCGDPQSRHDIIPAKNELAKKYGIKTAETTWEAKKKCSDLVLITPNHNKYSEYCEQINAIHMQSSRSNPNWLLR